MNDLFRKWILRTPLSARPTKAVGDHEPRAQLVRFLAVGLLNTAFGYCVYMAGLAFCLNPAMALFCAFGLGAIFNFATTGRFVFASRSVAVLPRFLLAYACLYLVNLGTLHLILAAGIKPVLAQLVALPPIVVVTFVTLRTFVFRKK